jgi:adenylate kinase family enzyme
VHRVLIIGCSGAGKSTLARKVGQRLGLPVIHLDAFFWQPGWKETPRDLWKQRVAELVRGECWVMDGNYGGTLEERVQAADTVVLLDLPRVQCLYRVIGRAVRDRGRTRPDLARGCLEQLPDWAFLRWIWNFPTAEMPVIRQILSKHRLDKTIIVLRSPTAVRRFLEALPEQATVPDGAAHGRGPGLPP